MAKTPDVTKLKSIKRIRFFFSFTARGSKDRFKGGRYGKKWFG